MKSVGANVVRHLPDVAPGPLALTVNLNVASLSLTLKSKTKHSLTIVVPGEFTSKLCTHYVLMAH